VSNELLALVRRERLVHRVAEGRNSRIAGPVDERLPGHGVGGAYLGFELKVDRVEPGLVGEIDQVALVEVDHGIGVRRLDCLVDRPHLGGDLGDGAEVEADPRAAGGLCEAVDRLEERDPSA
jgi:hypothetical protein